MTDIVPGSPLWRIELLCEQYELYTKDELVGLIQKVIQEGGHIPAPAQAAPQCRYPDGCSTLGGPCPTCYPDPLEDLVKRFSAALLAKLKLARENGRNGWEQPDWEDACQRGLLRHIEKGDPRDVAAYCAFMWHHGWITVAAQPPAAPVETVEAALRDAFPHFQDDAPITADAIRKLGNEWTEMVMGWSPVQREITFSDQDGNDRKLEWEVFENSAGWVIADSETWEVREPHPSPSAETSGQEG